MVFTLNQFHITHNIQADHIIMCIIRNTRKKKKTCLSASLPTQETPYNAAE